VSKWSEGFDDIDYQTGSDFGLPLHIAVMLGKESIVKALVENQAQEADGECMSCLFHPVNQPP
jgi:hypothetical protein